MNAGRVLLLGLFAVSVLATTSFTPRHNIHLNEDSLRFAEQLIADGHFIADKKGGWYKDEPSAEAENDFIRAHGVAEFAKWHLGIDDRHGENSKGRSKFPFGDFKNVHRCALIAIRSRARQYGYSEIENAAAELQRKLEQKAKMPR